MSSSSSSSSSSSADQSEYADAEWHTKYPRYEGKKANKVRYEQIELNGQILALQVLNNRGQYIPGQDDMMPIVRGKNTLAELMPEVKFQESLKSLSEEKKGVYVEFSEDGESATVYMADTWKYFGAIAEMVGNLPEPEDGEIPVIPQCGNLWPEMMAGKIIGVRTKITDVPSEYEILISFVALFEKLKARFPDASLWNQKITKENNERRIVELDPVIIEYIGNLWPTVPIAKRAMLAANILGCFIGVHLTGKRVALIMEKTPFEEIKMALGLEPDFEYNEEQMREVKEIYPWLDENSDDDSDESDDE